MSEKKDEWQFGVADARYLYSADGKSILGGVIRLSPIFPAFRIMFAPPNRVELRACTASDGMKLVEKWRAENAAEYESRRGEAHEGEGVRVEQVERAFLLDRGRDGSNG